MSTHKNDIAARLSLVMQAKGWTQQQLAHASGASKQTVSRWMADGGIEMEAEFAFRIEHTSGFSAEWVALGKGPMTALERAFNVLRHQFKG